MWIIKTLWTKSLGLLFPLKCLLCGEIGAGVCPSCLETLKRAVDTPHPDTYAYFSYKDPSVRKILRYIKYFRKLYLISPLVEHIIESGELETFLGTSQNALLIPIPMPRRRILERGGNHTLYVAAELSRVLSLPVENNLLLRRKDTDQQVHTHSRRERIKNITNAFTVNTQSLAFDKDKLIILVDDVTTTGATIREATQTLEKYGYEHIKAVTLAH